MEAFQKKKNERKCAALDMFSIKYTNSQIIESLRRCHYAFCTLIAIDGTWNVTGSAEKYASEPKLRYPR